MADIIPFEYNGKLYYLSSPTAEFKYYAEIIYKDVYEKSINENISIDDVIVILDKYKMWSEDDDNLLKKSRQELEDTKVNLFDNYLKIDKRDLYKKIISDIKIFIDNLNNKKSAMNSLTSEYIAFSAKQRFLIGSSILKPNKKRLWNKISDWDKENKIIDFAFQYLNSNFLDERDMRDIVKNEPWKTIWSLCKKPAILFRKNIKDFSEEQSNICVWSMVYDNINRSQERPSNEIIYDDDALDGWMIKEKRKKEIDSGKREISGKISDNVAKSEEIFVIADNSEQIQKIYNMNDFNSKIVVKKKLMQVKRDQFVDEVNMIDRREQIAIQANNLYFKGMGKK